MNSKNHFERAQHLLGAAQTNAISMYVPLSERFPELREVAKSGLYEYWDYFVTIASVGFAFMEIADSFQDTEDSDNVAAAVQEALNGWDKRPFKWSNYEVMINFLDTFDEFQKEGFPLDVSIGAWIWINLKGSEKATEDLKTIAEHQFYAKLFGHMIMATFHDWWKADK
jgi:hypothetical protein